jgi:hypothetical protein
MRYLNYRPYHVILIAGILLILTANNSLVYSQKFLTDSIEISFPADEMIEMRNICIRSIEDNRLEHPNFVRYNTKNKYLLFPVDQEVFTLNPLTDEISRGLKCDSAKYIYDLSIDKFSVIKQNSRFSSSLVLEADMPVYRFVNDSSIYMGTLYYDYIYLPGRKETLEKSTQSILSKWHTEFKLDLLSLKSDSFMQQKELSNFITDKSTRSLYLNTSVATFIGYNWWGFQGEIYFQRPETSYVNRYNAGIFRYQNTKEYESFALGKQSDHYMFRRSNDWLFDLDFNFLIGFCKWKDLEKIQPTFYQLFDFEISSSQTIQYSPLNNKGLTFRIGTIESFNFVIDRKPKFFAGAIFGLGIRI